MEIESALVRHPSVAEAAVVGRPTSSRPGGVRLRDTQEGRLRHQQIGEELRQWVRTRSAASPAPPRSAAPKRCPKNAQRKDHAPPAAGNRHTHSVTGDVTRSKICGVSAWRPRLGKQNLPFEIPRRHAWPDMNTRSPSSSHQVAGGDLQRVAGRSSEPRRPNRNQSAVRGA